MGGAEGGSMTHIHIHFAYYAVMGGSGLSNTATATYSGDFAGGARQPASASASRLVVPVRSLCAALVCVRCAGASGVPSSASVTTHASVVEPGTVPGMLCFHNTTTDTGVRAGCGIVHSLTVCFAARNTTKLLVALIATESDATNTSTSTPSLCGPLCGPVRPDIFFGASRNSFHY
jgi:hypothetical protein